MRTKYILETSPREFFNSRYLTILMEGNKIG